MLREWSLFGNVKGNKGFYESGIRIMIEHRKIPEMILYAAAVIEVSYIM